MQAGMESVGGCNSRPSRERHGKTAGVFKQTGDWNMKLTKRGRVVVGVLIALAVAGVYYIATHVWWVGDGWCFDSLPNCMLAEQASVDGANS